MTERTVLLSQARPRHPVGPDRGAIVPPIDLHKDKVAEGEGTDRSTERRYPGGAVPASELGGGPSAEPPSPSPSPSTMHSDRRAPPDQGRGQEATSASAHEEANMSTPRPEPGQGQGQGRESDGLSARSSAHDSSAQKSARDGGGDEGGTPRETPRDVRRFAPDIDSFDNAGKTGASYIKTDGKLITCGPKVQRQIDDERRREVAKVATAAAAELGIAKAADPSRPGAGPAPGGAGGRKFRRTRTWGS